MKIRDKLFLCFLNKSCQKLIQNHELLFLEYNETNDPEFEMNLRKKATSQLPGQAVKYKVRQTSRERESLLINAP